MTVEQVTHPQWKFQCDFCLAYVVWISNPPDGWEHIRGDAKNEKWEVHLCPQCQTTVALSVIRYRQSTLFREKATMYTDG